jgi:hypothetical protein
VRAARPVRAGGLGKRASGNAGTAPQADPTERGDPEASLFPNSRNGTTAKTVSSHLDPLARADREQELVTWLDRNRVARAWIIAPQLAAAGVDLAWCARAMQRFHLHACVQALFTIKLPKQTTEQDQQAA